MKDEATLRRESALRWLELAQGDLRAARSDALEARHVCFFAQQAAEKALKSLLVYSDIDPPHTHDLNAVLQIMPDTWHVDLEEAELRALSQWAVESRYPVVPDPTADQAQEALRQATPIVEVAEAQLKRRINAEA